MLDLQLKEYTRMSHALLEKRLLGKITTIDSPRDYVALLLILYGYYAAIEECIHPYLDCSEIEDYPARRKAKRILDDISIHQSDPAIPSVCLQLPEVRSFYAALGVLYVIEGSTLGGEVIARIISKKLKMSEGFSFFQCYGEHVHHMWESFSVHLRKQYTPEQQSEILQAAQRTFATFNYWISSHD